jgi:rubrerythrin
LTKTENNLKSAFAGESQANRRYLAFAKKAEDEGYAAVAKLFRAAAAAETIHAHNHLRAMGGIQSTSENLKAAIGGENHEITSMYPEFIADAEAEAEKRALSSFKWAFEVEKGHEELFREALAKLGEDMGVVEIWVCSVCGYTHIGIPPEKCPVCGTPGKRFDKID